MEERIRKMEERKNVVAYVRVSTEGQTGEDTYGIEAQREDIKVYCKEHNMNIMKWYEDVISGKTDSRPAFNEILYGGISNPPVEAVVVARNDRLSRDIMNYYWFKKELLTRNIELISIAEDFGRDDMFSKIYEAISIGFAELERQKIAERLSSARNVKSKQGGYSGGHPPYGYKVVNGELVIDEVQAKAVVEIFKMHDEGKSTRYIANEINNMGYKSKSGKPFQNTSIAVIIKNRKTYEGYYKYGKNSDWVIGKHKAILND